MKLKNRLIFLILILAICLSFFNLTSFAEEKSASGVIPKLPQTANDPQLLNGHVYPEWGPVCQRYTYSVIYRDKEGRKPEYVQIYFNGQMIDMTPVNAGDSSYKKGVRYQYQFVPDKIDSNFYYFEASNGLGKTRESIIDSPDNGPVLFESAFDKNEVVLIDPSAGSEPDSVVWRFSTGKEWVGGVALSDDGQYLAALTSQHVYFFSTKSNQPLWQYEFNQGSPVGGGPRGNGIAISGDGKRIVAAIGMQVALFGSENNKPLWQYQAPALAVTISKDGKYLASASVKQGNQESGNVILFWQVDNKEPVWEYPADSNFHDVSISADGQYLAASTGCPDRKAYIFSKNSNQPIFKSDRLTYDSPISKSKISADGSLAAFTTEGGPESSVVVLFSKDNTQPLWKFDNGKQNSSRTMSMSADGNFIAAATMRGDVYLLGKTSNQPLKSWATNSSVGALDISDDGKFIALGGSDNQVWILPTNGGEKKIPVNEFVQTLDISANGKLLAAGTGGSVYFFESYLSPNKNKVFACSTVIEPPDESLMRNLYEGKDGQDAFNQPLLVNNKKLPGMLFGFGLIGSILLLLIFTVVRKLKLLTKIKLLLDKLNKTRPLQYFHLTTKKVNLILSLLILIFFLLTVIAIFTNRPRSEKLDDQRQPPLQSQDTETDDTQNGTVPKEPNGKNGSDNQDNSVCGNDICEPDAGETKENCSKDCSGKD